MKIVGQSLSMGVIGIIVLGLALQGHYSVGESFIWVLLTAALVGVFGGCSGI